MKIVISVLLLLGFVQAASFDCAKATIKVEKAVCANSELSYLDEKLSAEYKHTYSIFLEEQEKEALVKNQREWMKKRNECVTTKCLKSSYKTRIAHLKSYRENYNLKLPPVEFEMEHINSEAFLSIKPLGYNIYMVSGEAFYGTKRELGPNIGTVDFIAELKSNKLQYKHKYSDYLLTIKVFKDKLDVSERDMGPFGMNVRFTGSYQLKNYNLKPKLIVSLLNGEWKSNKYYESSNCGKTGNFKTEALIIKVEYPSVTIKDLETGKEYFYTINKHISSNFKTVYEKSEAHLDAQHWGSCGGSVKIPYLKSYDFFILKDKSTDKTIRMVYSKNDKGSEALIVDIWSNAEFSLENEEFFLEDTDRNKKTNLSLIEDGYTLQKTQ